MRNEYWAMYNQMKFNEFYYSHYLTESILINRFISVVTCIVSAASIASWAIWDVLGVFWAILVGISQAITTIHHLLPFSDRITSLTFLTSELSQLLTDISRDWNRINYSDSKISDDEIIELIYKHERQYDELVAKYIGFTSLPEKNVSSRRRQKIKFRILSSVIMLITN